MNSTFVTHCRIGTLIGLLLGGFSAAAIHVSTIVWPVTFGMVGLVVGGAVGSFFHRVGAKPYGSVETGALVGAVTAYIVGYFCLGSAQLSTFITCAPQCVGFGVLDLLLAIPVVVPGALVGMFVDGAMLQPD